MVLTQLEVEYEDLATLLDKFPYHYGSYATPPGDSKINKSRHVSIPLWFSRNQKKVSIYIAGDCVFPYHYGSYATTLRKKLTCVSPRFHTTMVLTQLWVEIGFNGLSVFSFHTTMVLTQPFNYASKFNGTHQLFPYHYGSYATWNTERIHTIREVSIPLWFLRNS